MRRAEQDKERKEGLSRFRRNPSFRSHNFVIVHGFYLLLVSSILLNLGLNHSDKFAGAYVQRIGNFPKSFKICLLSPVLDHRQMCAGNSRETAQNVLRYAFLIAEIAYCFPYRVIVELHRLTPLSQQLVYEKT